MDTKRVRNVLAGFVLLGGFAASASAQVRDHRTPPVVVRDHRLPPVVVRDHRTPPVVVRDHRTPPPWPVTRVPARPGPR